MFKATKQKKTDKMINTTSIRDHDLYEQYKIVNAKNRSYAEQILIEFCKLHVL